MLGTLERDGYRVEKLVFQTRPGVWMTANAYVPDAPGKHPAILVVHGHWRGAKQDPVVQARCIGAAKLGFFVLAVDAFGAGERGVGKALGEYHGEMTARDAPARRPAALGAPGLREHAGPSITCAPGPRSTATGSASPAPAAAATRRCTPARWTSGSRRSSRSARSATTRPTSAPPAACARSSPGPCGSPRSGACSAWSRPAGLMVVNATRDALQFSVAEAKKSLALAEPVFRLYGKPGHVRHAIFESGHDYSQADARGDVRLDDPPPEGRGRRLADRRARDQDRGPRDAPLLSRATPGPTTG